LFHTVPHFYFPYRYLYRNKQYKTMKYLREFNSHSQYEAFTGTSEFILPNVSICNDTPNEVHYNPYVDPCASEKVKTTYEWVEIGGVKWATKNVGALTVTDYGQYFQWGDTQGFTADQVSGNCHSKTFDWVNYKYGNGTSSPGATGMTKYNSTDGKTVLDLSDDAARVNMGGLWRMPTTEEFQALGTATTSAWTTDYQGSGVSGLVLTDKTDSSKVLFFPAAGNCNNGSVDYVGSNGNYWSSSVYSSNVQYAYYLAFGSSNVNWRYVSNRYGGYAVRGVLGE
jgi:uncharacterized protein (TIGR02145 family)